MTDKLLSRRSFIAGAAAVGAVAVAVPALAAEPQALAPQAAAPKPPYLYTKQDPDKVARRAYEIYYKQGCCEATFFPLVEALAADTANADAALWAGIPNGLFVFGGGGVNGWATVCGTCNGSAAILKIMKNGAGVAAPGALIDAALKYYTDTPLPTNGAEKSYRGSAWTMPTGTPTPKANVPTSTAHSALCHASLTQWMATTHEFDGSAGQKDRCAKACYDMAYNAVTLLNNWIDGTTPAAWNPNVVSDCAPCHLSANTSDLTVPMKSKMECSSCHDDQNDNYTAHTGRATKPSASR